MGLFDFFKKKDNAKAGERDTALTPIGYKSGWVAVKADSPKDVIKKLGFNIIKQTDWNTGLESLKPGRVYVSDPVNGYVIIIDEMMYLIFDENSDDKGIKDIAQKFDFVMGFATHRVVEAHYWSKYINGKCVRKYSFVGESCEIFSDGELTEEEIDLGFNELIQTEDDMDDEEKQFPDEENVMDISKAWGIDPEMTGISNINGYICRQ